jgi:hypothetical protein
VVRPSEKEVGPMKWISCWVCLWFVFLSPVSAIEEKDVSSGNLGADAKLREVPVIDPAFLFGRWYTLQDKTIFFYNFQPNRWMVFTGVGSGEPLYARWGLWLNILTLNYVALGTIRYEVVPSRDPVVPSRDCVILRDPNGNEMTLHRL